VNARTPLLYSSGFIGAFVKFPAEIERLLKRSRDRMVANGAQPSAARLAHHPLAGQRHPRYAA
jgi:hypothetical protein